MRGKFVQVFGSTEWHFIEGFNYYAMRVSGQRTNCNKHVTYDDEGYKLEQSITLMSIPNNKEHGTVCQKCLSKIPVDSEFHQECGFTNKNIKRPYLKGFKVKNIFFGELDLHSPIHFIGSCLLIFIFERWFGLLSAVWIAIALGIIWEVLDWRNSKWYIANGTSWSFLDRRGADLKDIFVDTGGVFLAFIIIKWL